MPEDKDCGSTTCLVDRLEETVRQQHTQSMSFIKELFQTHVNILQSEIKDLKISVKEQGDNLYDRMRIAETQITQIETRWTESDELKTVRTAKAWAGRIITSVAIVTIIGVVGYILYIYDIHGRPNEYPYQQSSRVPK